MLTKKETKKLIKKLNKAMKGYRCIAVLHKPEGSE